MDAPRVYSVLIVDDHPVTRLGLRYTFQLAPDFEVGGEASDLVGALDLLARHTPDLLIADLTLEGGRNGLELIRHLRRHHPGVQALVFSMHDVRLYAQRALSAGARGYVTKGSGHEEVLRAARTVLRGEVYFRGAAVPAARAQGEDDRAAAVAALTDREFEVFLLLGEGYAPRHIADALLLSVSTVEAYRERLKAKLGIEDAALLLRYAVRWLKDQELKSAAA